MRTIRLLNAALLAALLAGSFLAWPVLPDRIPVHFGIDGAADAWTRSTAVAWFALPVVALALNVLVLGAAALSTRNPRWINLPGKPRLLALPPERQQPVLLRLRAGLEALAPLITVIFSAIQLATFRAALGHDPRPLIIAGLLISVLGAIAIPIAMILSVQAELERQHALHRRGGPA